MIPGRGQRGVLVAGVGNIFQGDDGFGVEVARRMAARPLPEDVRVADYGIRSLHLAYDLLEAAPGTTTIIVDAMPRGGKPGTLYVMEPAAGAATPQPVADGHSVSPDAIVALVRSLGGSPGRLLVVGCEPADVGERMGLTPAVAAAVDEAADLVLSMATASQPLP